MSFCLLAFFGTPGGVGLRGVFLYRFGSTTHAKEVARDARRIGSEKTGEGKPNDDPSTKLPLSGAKLDPVFGRC